MIDSFTNFFTDIIGEFVHISSIVTVLVVIFGNVLAIMKPIVLSDIPENSIITDSNCIDIPNFIIEFLNSSQVVVDNPKEKRHKNEKARNVESSYSLVV